MILRFSQSVIFPDDLKYKKLLIIVASLTVSLYTATGGGDTV